MRENFIMTSRLRVVPELGTRLFSRSLRAHEAIATTAFYPVAESVVRPKVSRVGDVLKSTASHTYLHSLSEVPASYITNEPLPSKTQFKHQLSSLLREKKHDRVLQVLLSLTSLTSKVQWTDALSQQELSTFISLLVTHQVSLIRGAAQLKASKSSHHAKFVEARHFREAIRRVYANLIGVDHLYSKRTYDLTALSVSDYENLISLELGNNKLDLASKWFLRFDAQYSLQHMTPLLWVLKLQVYAGGASRTWDFKNSSFVYKRTKRGHLISAKSWLEVFNEYLESQAAARASVDTSMLSSAFNAALIQAIGHAGDVAYLQKYIERVWGITNNGVSDSLTRFPPSHPSYPSLEVLEAIVAAFSYNGQFYQAMSYVNKFQDAYEGDVDLSGKSLNSLWGYIFRWADLLSRFDKREVLNNYVKEHAGFLIKDKAQISLEEAQQSLHFDLENFMNHVKELEDKRASMMTELWTLYTATNDSFSAEAYRVFGQFVAETTDEALVFSYLTSLSKQHHYLGTNPSSFNVRYLHTTPNAMVYSLYSKTLEQLVDKKGFSGHMGQIGPLVQEWSLDEPMRQNTLQHARTNRKHYDAALEQRRREMMHEQRTDDEPFLDLI